MVNNVLNSDIPPFDLLSEGQLAVLTQSLSIVYFEAGEDIIPAEGSPEGIYIIIKGQKMAQEACLRPAKAAHYIISTIEK